MAQPLSRAETIIEKVETLLTGLTTTGNRIFRSRAFPLERKTDFPALLLFPGTDLMLDQQTPDELIMELEIFVDAYAALRDGAAKELEKIRRELTIPLATDSNGEPKLDLGDFVEYIEELGADEIEVNADGSVPAMMQRSLWRVVYFRSRSDPAN